MKIKRLLRLGAVKKEVTTVTKTLMRTSLMIPMPARTTTARSSTLMRARARTGRTLRPRLRRMTDTEKMMMTGAGGEKVAVGAAVTETGTVTDPTSLQRKANTEPPRRRASTATRAETAAGTARGREAARPTSLQRKANTEPPRRRASTAT